ncbi:hypothetical protein V8F20_003986 [Naviculisporaceae sp. PSN 640]
MTSCLQDRPLRRETCSSHDNHFTEHGAGCQCSTPPTVRLPDASLNPGTSCCLLWRTSRPPQVTSPGRVLLNLRRDDHLPHHRPLATMLDPQEDLLLHPLAGKTSSIFASFDWCLEVENQIDDKKTALPFTAMALKQNVWALVNLAVTQPICERRQCAA